ncbi:hypothetical protein HMPREF0044_0710 [Gleimia coleocanis DSM 15436]|uniref:Uncharacterized protein n=1 Tax=Gleimia coleocanis DSM 15436 TaxID=525245 RepID=C0W0W7_9ACTO|nr:hypothetical protein HMPREF0044_0710 [Gleimia coleocanis DSM 15436]
MIPSLAARKATELPSISEGNMTKTQRALNRWVLYLRAVENQGNGQSAGCL